jgi:LPXTG-motif cell wall-anchored protein
MRVCLVCDYAETRDVDENGHNWNSEFTIDKEATCTEDGSKSIHCKDCDVTKDSTVVSALGHSFTDYISNDDATCTADGTKTAKCDRCDVTDTVTDTDSAKGHTEVIDPAVDATCTETGLTQGSHCSQCGEILVEQTVVDKIGHNYEWVDSKSGVQEYKCTICGDVSKTRKQDTLKTSPKTGADSSEIGLAVALAGAGLAIIAFKKKEH